MQRGVLSRKPPRRSQPLVTTLDRHVVSCYRAPTEFVEIDDGRYAAGVSDPSLPRALLKDGDPIPDRFDGATSERTGQLPHGIRQGPSLRLVVTGSDEEAMVRRGYWVVGLRKRL